MTRISEVLWPVQSPPDGFAEATVERMLAVERGAPKTARSNRWLVLALAAVFVSGVAYGLGFRGREASQPLDPIALLPAMAATTPVVQRVPCVTPPRPPVMEFGHPVRAPARSTASAAVVVAPIRLVPNGPPKIPACQCERGFSDVICDCY
jgi:hypothetical protein